MIPIVFLVIVGVTLALCGGAILFKIFSLMAILFSMAILLLTFAMMVTIFLMTLIGAIISSLFSFLIF